MLRLITVLAAVALPSGAGAEPLVSYEVDAPYDDVAFELEIAIEERGYVVDHVSHVGDMLARTAEDVGAEETLFEKAAVYQFCSATLSREMMAADRLNIAFCPYGIFVYQQAGAEGSVIGYRTMPEGEMQKVEALLDQIARQAAGME